MMAGDAYCIPIKINTANGAADDSTFLDIEVCIGHVRKTLFGGDLGYDSELNAFLVPLSQEETFSLRGRVKVNVRCKMIGSNVIGVDLGTLDFEPSLSKEVL